MLNSQKRIGYARVSTEDQTLNLQKDALVFSGCEVVFTEVASGKNTTTRNQLKSCLKKLKPGDTLVVWRLDRLGRSVQDLINILTGLERRNIYFESLMEHIDTTSHTGKLIFHVFAALAEFERNLIRERTLAGLAAAKLRGRTGGRNKLLNAQEITEIKHSINTTKCSITHIALKYGVSRGTIYNALKTQAPHVHEAHDMYTP
ncbi:recombinase family protein [Neisseriaceae bacterium CLB008]